MSSSHASEWWAFAKNQHAAWAKAYSEWKEAKSSIHADPETVKALQNAAITAGNRYVQAFLAPSDAESVLASMTEHQRYDFRLHLARENETRLRLQELSREPLRVPESEDEPVVSEMQAAMQAALGGAVGVSSEAAETAVYFVKRSVEDIRKELESALEAEFGARYVDEGKGAKQQQVLAVVSAVLEERFGLEGPRTAPFVSATSSLLHAPSQVHESRKRARDALHAEHAAAQAQGLK